MKPFRHVPNHYQVPSPLRAKKFTGVLNINEPMLNPQSSEWCERAFPKLIKLSHLLKGLDLSNGRLVNVQDECVVNNEFLIQSMHTLKSIGAAFVIQTMHTCANKPIYKEPFSINSLKKVCDMLVVSAQHRKLVRLAICPQVTQHQIWMGALTEILNQLKHEMSVTKATGGGMAQQIVVNCLRLLDDAMSYDPDSTSWMRLAPKKDADSPPSAKWADLVEMFDDLVTCLKDDHRFFYYVMKLEIMKEGLLQIKDGLVDKNIGYKEARHQQSLVQKKLTKSLGHSSKCLFTLLLYYLYGSVQDIELDVCCWSSKDKLYLCVGKIMTSDDDKMLMHVVKQLDRAIGVIKFVHELAEMEELLEFQGHVWCIGAESRSVTYRGHDFFIHGISL